MQQILYLGQPLRVVPLLAGKAGSEQTAAQTRERGCPWLCCVGKASMPLRGLPGQAWLKAPGHYIRCQGSGSGQLWAVTLGTHSDHTGFLGEQVLPVSER